MNEAHKQYAAPDDLLDGRTILITGAGDGIGRAVALACARHGASVVLLGRTIAKLEKVYDEIEAQARGQAAIYPMNLEGAAPEAYADLANTLDVEFGRLDGLLHNAAELGTLTPLGYYEVELWYRVMQVNLNAPFLLTRACLPLLRKSDAASVLFTLSELSDRGRAYWGAYGASQSALRGLLETLADETENDTGLRVNGIDPGPVRTAMRTKAYPAEERDAVPPPEAVVASYLYLLGRDSAGISGEVLRAQ